eukprot:scaffold1118_cov135-Cylindrotheca_fusiformis.AAC.3
MRLLHSLKNVSVLFTIAGVSLHVASIAHAARAVNDSQTTSSKTRACTERQANLTLLCILFWRSIAKGQFAPLLTSSISAIKQGEETTFLLTTMRIQRHRRKADTAVKEAEAESYNQKRAQQFYKNYQPAQSSAVVETVFRKPKTFANLHEYDGKHTVDHVPTAVGFNSFDSADEIMEAKMKPRYDFTVAPEHETKNDKEEIKDKTSTRTPPDYAPQLEELKNAVGRLRKVTKGSKFSNQRGKAETRAKIDERSKEADKEEVDNDRYGGLSNLIVSEDDSCPAMWKSYSEDSADEKNLTRKSTTEETKRRRAAAIVEAKRIRALNSVADSEEQTPFEVDMGMDPRLRPNTGGSVSGSSRKSWSSWRNKSRMTNTAADSTPNLTGVTETTNKKQLAPFSVVSNSIVASQQPPPNFSENIVERMRYDDASYGTESQSKSYEDEMESRQSSANIQSRAPMEKNLAKYVFEGLSNFANVNYWFGEQERKTEKEIGHNGSRDDSRSTKTSKSSAAKSLTLEKVHSKQLSPKSLSPSKKAKPSSAMVSEISFPTPEPETIADQSINDDVSILGLDKQKRMTTGKQQGMKKHVEDSENHVPQQLKKKGNSKVFGNILGHKTKA